MLLSGCWAAIAGAENLRVITDDSPPVSGLADGNLVGWGVDVVREIQRRVGSTAKIEIMPWARALKLAQQADAVAVFATMRTEERARFFQWVGPLQTLNLAFYVRADSETRIDSLEDAMKLGSIGVPRQFAVDEELTALGFGNLDRVANPNQMVRKLMTGRNDAIASDDGFVSRRVFAAKDVPVEALRPAFRFGVRETYIAFSLSTPPELVTAWQKALDAMKADGTFAKLTANRM